jgi:hypothetical protein
VFVLWKRCWRVCLAEERSIRYVLEGGVQKSDDKVRIAIAIYVRYWGKSGHPTSHPFESAFGGKADIESLLSGTHSIIRRECPLLGVKRTFASHPLDVRL